MADDEYQRKLRDLQQYVPFLENTIRRLKSEAGKPREAQITKLQSLLAILTDTKKKLKYEALKKCEEVILKLYDKVEKKPAIETMHKYMCRNPPEEISLPYNRAPVAGGTEEYRLDNEVSLSLARQKLHKQTDLATPASPSPPINPPLLAPIPVVIPTEKVSPKGTTNTYFIPVVDSFNSNQTERDYVEDGWCNNFNDNYQNNTWQRPGFSNRLPLTGRTPPGNRIITNNRFISPPEPADSQLDMKVTLNNRPVQTRLNESPRNWMGNEQLYQRRNDVSRPPLPDRFGVWKRMSFEDGKTTKPNREVVTYSDALPTSDIDLEDPNYHVKSSVTKDINPELANRTAVTPLDTGPVVSGKRTPIRICFNKDKDLRLPTNLNKPPLSESDLQDLLSAANDSPSPVENSPIVNDDMDLDRLEELRRQISKELAQNKAKGKEKHQSKPKSVVKVPTPLTSPTPSASANSKPKTPRVVERVIKEQDNIFGNLLSSIDEQIMVKKKEHKKVEKKDGTRKEDSPKKDVKKSDSKESKDKVDSKHKDSKAKDDKHKDKDTSKSKDTKTSSSDSKHKDKSKLPKDTQKSSNEDPTSRTSLNVKDVSKLNEKIKASFLKEDSKTKETDKNESKSAKSKDDAIFKDNREHSKHRDESKSKGKHDSKHKSEHKSSSNKSKDSSKDNSKEKEKCKTPSKDDVKDKNKDLAKSASKTDSKNSLPETVTKVSDNCKSEQKCSDNNHSSSVSNSNNSSSAPSDKKDDDKITHSNRISDKYPHKRKTSTEVQKSQSEPKPLDVISKFISERIPMNDPKPKIPNTEVHPIKLADPRLRNHSDLKSPTDTRHFSHSMADEDPSNMNPNFQNQFPNEQNTHRFAFPQDNSQTLNRPNNFMCEQNIRPNNMFPNEQQMLGNGPVFPHEVKQMNTNNFDEPQMDNRFNNFGPDHPNIPCNFNADPHHMDEFMNEPQMMNRNVFAHEMQQAGMNRPPSIESFHSSEMTPGDSFSMNNEQFAGSNMHLERGKSPFPNSNFNNHDPRNHIPVWSNNKNPSEQQFHMQQNQFNPGQNQSNCFPDRGNMVSPDFNTAQAQRFSNFPQNQQRFPGQPSQTMGHFGNMHDPNFDNTQYDLSQINPLDFYDRNQDGVNPDSIPSLFDLDCEFSSKSENARFRGRGSSRGNFRGSRGADRGGRGADRGGGRGVNRGGRGADRGGRGADRGGGRGADRGGRGAERGGRGADRGGRGADRGGRSADRGSRSQFSWINPNRRSSMSDEYQEEYPTRNFNSGSRFSNDDPKGNRFSSSDEGKDDYLNRKFGNRYDDAKDEFPNRMPDFRRRYDDEDTDKRRSRFSSKDDMEYPGRKYGNSRFSDDSKDGFSHRKFGSRFSVNEDSRKFHSNKFSSNEDSNEYSERKYGNQRFPSSKENKDDHHSRRFNSGSRFSSSDEPKEEHGKKSDTSTRSEESKEENSTKKSTVENTDNSSTKTDSKEKEPVKSKEEIFSPLDSLYDAEKMKIGKGYGFQKFKIPKLKRNSVEENKEKTATAVKVEDDKSVEEYVKVEAPPQQVEEDPSTVQDETPAADKNKNEADQKLETFNNFMKQLFETSDSSVFLQFLDRFGCSLPKAKTKRIRRIIESDSDESDEETKEKPEKFNDKSSEVDEAALLKTPEKKPKEETDGWSDSVVESVGERIKNRRRRKLDSSSESSPEKVITKKEDGEEPTNEANKEEESEDQKSSEDSGKKIAKTKRRNALQLLQDDIRDMFISEGVLTATGHRMCRMMKEHQDSVLHSSQSELDSPQVKNKDSMTTSDDEDLPLARRKKKFKTKVDKTKMEALEAPRLYPKRLRSSPRVVLEKLEKPELTKMVTQDDEAESSDNSSDNEPLIKDIKRPGRPPKRVDSDVDTAPVDNGSTSESLPPPPPTGKKRGRPLSKRGRKKAVKAEEEVKLDETDKESVGESSTVSESPSKLDKSDNDQVMTALSANPTVGKTVKKALGKKKRKSWAQGVIKKKAMKQAGKRQPSPSFSNADVSDQLSVSETTNDPEMADVEMDLTETDNQEADNQSDNEEYSLLAIDLTPDVNYFLDNGSKFDCKLCDYKGKFIVHHYKFKHPESENMISRLSPEAAQTAVQEATGADFASIVPFEEVVKNKKRRTTFCCRFCGLTLKQENVTNFFDHLTCHTGEYRYQCEACTFYSGSRKALSSHINHEHPSYKKPVNIVPIFPAPPNFRIVFGYLCKACNFTQLLKANVEKHIKLSHPDQEVDIIKINLSTKSVPLADLNKDEPNTGTVSETVPQTPPVDNKPEEKVIELPKEPDMTVFMVPEDISVREKLIEDERLRKMQEVISNITPRRSTLQFVDKLKTKLDKAQIDEDLHEEITIEDVTTEEQISLAKQEKEEAAQVEEITPENSQEKWIEIKSTCSLASTDSDVITVTPSSESVVSVQPSVGDSTISDLVSDTIPSDTESVADAEEPIDVTNVELNLPTDSKQKGVLDTIQRLAAQLQTSPAKPVSILETDTSHATDVEPKIVTFECEPKTEVQRDPAPETLMQIISRAPLTQPQFDLLPQEHTEVVPSPLQTQTQHEPESVQSQEILIPIMLKHAPTLQPSDSEVIINVGPIEVRLNQKDAHYYCLVEGCKFSSAYKISFTKHCSDQHQKLMFNCNICQKNGKPVLLCTMMSLFVHLFDKHKENSKPKLAVENEPQPKAEPGKIRLRRISGDVLSTPCSDTLFTAKQPDAQPQPAAAVQPEITVAEKEQPNPPPPGFLQIIDVRTLTPEEENLTYGSAIANGATDPSSLKKISPNSRFVFSPKHVLIPVKEVAKYSKIVDSLSQKTTKIVKMSKPNKLLGLNNKVEPATGAQMAVVKPSTSGTTVSMEVVKPRLPADTDDINLAFNELKTSKSKEILQEMLKLPKISELYKCPLDTCSYSTRVQRQFETHFTNHNCTAMGYYCVYCMSVVRSGNLLGHIDSKHGHCLYQCAYCFYRSIVASYVIIHQKKYHCKEGVRIIQLPKNQAARMFLMNNIDRPIPRKQTILPYICNQDKCKSRFLIVDDFMTHLQSTHKWYFLCSRCQTSSKYSTPANLITHYVVHCIAMYQCRFCLFGSQKPEMMHDHYAIWHPSCNPVAYVRQYKSRFAASTPEEDRLQEVNLDRLNVNVINTLRLASSAECSTTEPTVISAPSATESSLTISSSSLSMSSSSLSISSSSLSVSSSSLSIPSTSLTIPSSSLNIPSTSLTIPSPSLTIPSSSLSVSSSSLTIPSSSLSMSSSSLTIPSSSLTIPSSSLSVSSSSFTIPSSSLSMSSSSLTIPSSSLTIPSSSLTIPSSPLSIPSSPLSIASSSLSIPSAVNTTPERKKHIIESVLIEDSPKPTTQVIDVIDLSDDALETEISDTAPSAPAVAEFGEPMVLLKHRTVASSNAVANAVDPLNLDEPVTGENTQTPVETVPTIRLIEDISKFSEQSSKISDDSQPCEKPTDAKDKQESDKIIDAPPTVVVGKSDNGFSGRDLFRCGTPDCNYQAATLRDFKSHMFKCDVLKVDGGWYTCVHCQKRFKFVGGLLEHIQVHGVLRFSCSMCKYRTSLCHLIAQHMKIEHKIQTCRLVPVEPTKNDLTLDRFVANPTRTKMKRTKDLTELSPAVDDTPLPSASPVEDKNMFGPEDIERLPRPPVYAQEIKCKLCMYCTKVRSNMQRHLQQHIDEKMVPETAPVNPVPCLEKNEKMFDKMTNLAASSHYGRMGGKSGEKSEKGLSKEEETALPGFVPANKRYVCGAEGCSYLTHGDSMLRQHFTTLHFDVTSYKCPHCQVELLSDIDGLAIDNILFHLKMHDLHLYKCSHCSFYHYQKHKLDKHISDKHPDRIPYMHIIRELDNSANQQDTRVGTAVKPTIDAQAELKPWRCGFCTFSTNNRTDVQYHASQAHNIKSQFKCGLCQFRCSAKNNYQSHFKTKHPNCEINILSVYYKLTEEDMVKKAVIEPVVEQETFDTTPLWSRDKPRIRHIRGILLDESKSSKKIAAKVDKSTVDLNKLTADKTNEDTATAAGKLNADNAKVDSKKSPKANVIAATKLPVSYGVPAKLFYVCPFCEKYKSKSVKEFVVHLYTEMKYYRCACSLCDFKSVDMSLVKLHWAKSHNKDAKEEIIIPIQPDGRIERWVEKCIQHQQKAMRKLDESLNSSAETIVLHLDEEMSNTKEIEPLPLEIVDITKEPEDAKTDTDNLDFDSNLTSITPPESSTPTLSITMDDSKNSSSLDTTDNDTDTSLILTKPVNVNHLQCDHCPFIAKTVQTLRKHIKRHFIHKPFRCNCCKFQAVNRQGIVAHFALRHKQAELSYTEIPAPDEPILKPLKRKRYGQDPLEPPSKTLVLDATATLDISTDFDTDSKSNTLIDSINLDDTDMEIKETIEKILDTTLDIDSDELDSKTMTDNLEPECNITTDSTLTDNVDAGKLAEKPVKGKGKKKLVVKLDNTEKTETVTYICYHCPRRSENLDTIRNHFISIHDKIHKGCFKYKKLTVDKTKQVKRYNCKYCPWSGLPDGLKQHHMEQHNDKICVFEKATRFKCNECHEIFPKVHLLRKHFQSMHPDLSLSYQSVLDDNGDGDLLDSVVIMEEQLDIAPETKVLHCEYCPDTFQDTVQLMNHHNLLHSHLELKLESDQQKKFKCPACGHTSNSYPAMRDHLRSHNKPYKCHYCALTGSYPSIIKTHHVKEHRSLEFKYDSNPDAKKMNEELRENLLILGNGGTYHVKNALKRQSSDLELPAAKIMAVESLADVSEPSTSTGAAVKKCNVAKKSTALPPNAAPPQRVAKKSTTPRAVKQQVTEGYSFYRTKPCDIDEYKNVMSEINIMGKTMPINVVAMSNVLNLFPKVLVEDFNKTKHS